MQVSVKYEMWIRNCLYIACFFPYHSLFLVLNFHCPVNFGFLHYPVVTSVISMVYFSPALCVYSVYFTELNKTNVNLNIYSHLCLLAAFSLDKIVVFFFLAFTQFLVYNRTLFSNQFSCLPSPAFFNSSVQN